MAAPATAAAAGGSLSDGEMAPMAVSSHDEGEELSSRAPLMRGVQRAVSSVRAMLSVGGTRTSNSLSASKRSESAGTARMSVQGSINHLPPHQGTEGPSSWREDGPETIVQQDGIKPGMKHTIFDSKRHGFRLHVQEDSVQDEQTSGPIKVQLLEGPMAFEGGELEGVLEVECFPSKRRFDAPLLFDFLVDSGNNNDPIVDDYGRIRYEVLTRDCGSNNWVRDPEGSVPLKIVQGDQGRIYVRAEVRHFSGWGLWKKKLDLGSQQFNQETLPWVQRKRHQSVIMNKTPRDVRIHVYVMRLSRWRAAVKSLNAGVGVEEVQARFGFTGNLHQDIDPAAKVPQMATIPPGQSHYVEIPRVGAGIRSSRKAAVAIVTDSNDEKDGRKMRMEAMVHLRSKTLLTVTLQVDEEGKVIGSAAAEEEGGILSQVMRVIQNKANASPRSSAPNTDGRSRSDANTATTGSAVSVSTSATDRSVFWRVSAGLPTDSPPMAESKSDENSPCAVAADNKAGDVAGPGNGS